MSRGFETRLNVQFAPLEVIDEKKSADGGTYKWFNQTLCAVNDSVVRLRAVIPKGVIRCPRAPQHAESKLAVQISTPRGTYSTIAKENILPDDAAALLDMTAPGGRKPYCPADDPKET